MATKRLNMFLLGPVTPIPNTITNLGKASRTGFQSDQIGQFSSNKVRTRIGTGELREKTREAIGRRAARWRAKRRSDLI